MKATATVSMKLENADLLFTVEETGEKNGVNVRGALVGVGIIAETLEGASRLEQLSKLAALDMGAEQADVLALAKSFTKYANLLAEKGFSKGASEFIPVLAEVEQALAKLKAELAGQK